jgi:hypothetical protein
MPIDIYTFAQCPHFCCVDAQSDAIEVLDNFSEHAHSSLFKLQAGAVERHVSSPDPCPDCSKLRTAQASKSADAKSALDPEGAAAVSEAVELLRLAREGRRAVDDLKEIVEDVISDYDDLGERYHDTPMAARARTASSPEAALAHQQFTTESAPLCIDRWLAPAWQAVNSTQNVEDMLQSDPDKLSKDMLELTFACLNDARISLSVFAGRVKELSKAVVLVENQKVPEEKQYIRFADGVLPTRAILAKRLSKARWQMRMDAAFS